MADKKARREARRVVWSLRQSGVDVSVDYVARYMNEIKEFARRKGKQISNGVAGDIALRKLKEAQEKIEKSREKVRGERTRSEESQRRGKGEESQEGARGDESQETRRIANILSGLRNLGSKARSAGGDYLARGGKAVRGGVSAAATGFAGATAKGYERAKSAAKENVLTPIQEYRAKKKQDREYNERAEDMMTPEQKEASEQRVEVNKAHEEAIEEDRDRQAEDMMTPEQKKQSQRRAFAYKAFGRTGYRAMATGGGAIKKAGSGVMAGGAIAAGAIKRASGGTLFILIAILVTLIDNKIIPFNKIPIISYIASLVGLSSTYHGLRFEYFASVDWLGFLTSAIFFGIVAFFYLYQLAYGRKTIFSVLILFAIFGILSQDIIIPLKSLLPTTSYLIIGGVVFIALAALLITRFREQDVFLTKEEITIMLLAFVSTFLYAFRGSPSNPIGWMFDEQGFNLQATLHVFFIGIFGFVYIRPNENEKGEPSKWHLWLVGLWLIDLFATGYLENTPYLQFMPFLVLAVSMYVINAEQGNKLAWIVIIITLLSLFFWPSTAEAQTGSARLTRADPTGGQQAQSVADKLVEAIKRWSEQQLEVATGGLYRGRVEENQYEKLGVYLDKIRASEPKFYTDEPVTIWATVKAKTLSDVALVNFYCYKWTPSNQKIRANKIIPENPFPIFNLEERDAECTFDHRQGDEPQKFEAGTHVVTMSADYNFVTDAYLKAYFIDRDRYRAMIREELDPFEQFGITDKNPVAIYTNGPVEIGMDLTPLIPVARTYVPSPVLKISLNNRGKVMGEEGQVLGEYEGTIKNIVELIILLPKGSPISSPSADCGDKVFNDYTKEDCEKVSCIDYVLDPCQKVCDTITDQQEKDICMKECGVSKDNCINDCDTLFHGDGTEYKGYMLDTTQLKKADELKDIPRYKTFACRLSPQNEVLGSTPITTRFVRVRARYDYSMQKSVNVPVELAPGLISHDIAGIVLDQARANEVPALWPAAIAKEESDFKHCCRTPGKNTNVEECEFTKDLSCGDDRILTGDGGMSVGIMQVNKGLHQDLVSQVCAKDQTLNDLECNIKVGIKLLKNNYNGLVEIEGKKKIPSRLIVCNSEPYLSKYKAYAEWEAAVRMYNGLGCANDFVASYVERVKNQACGMVIGTTDLENAPPNFRDALINDPQQKIACP